MYCHEKKARQAGVYRPLPPQVRNPFGFRQCVGVVNNKYGFVVDTEMSLVQKGPQQKIEMTAMILYARIRLLHQHTSWLPMPNAGPRLIRPAQAKRKVRYTRSKNNKKRAFQQAPSGEPVVVIAECLDAVFPSHVGLRPARLWLSFFFFFLFCWFLCLVLFFVLWFGLCGFG